MIAAPWDLILTLTFAATGLLCVLGLVQDRPTGADGTLSDEALIHVGHLVMSIAMILMVWVMVDDVVTWAQVAIFAIAAASLAPAFARSESVAQRTDLIGHVVFHAAMIWMLAAMPLLMAGAPVSGEGGGHHHHAEAGAGPALTATPAWADGVNLVFVALSAAAAGWWLVGMFRGSARHRIHLGCFSLMGAGMAVMLVVMNV
ncbi:MULTISPECIES: DUF5134 domain-containing protein [unclassified Microbacterium]|uniref:DUF5134 domain-containing protein n=1 Tax=unclassified Microbacterium TaxID=2609290 RepID=UPI00386B494D